MTRRSSMDRTKEHTTGTTPAEQSDELATAVLVLLEELQEQLQELRQDVRLVREDLHSLSAPATPRERAMAEPNPPVKGDQARRTAAFDRDERGSMATLTPSPEDDLATHAPAFDREAAALQAQFAALQEERLEATERFKASRMGTSARQDARAEVEHLRVAIVKVQDALDHLRRFSGQPAPVHSSATVALAEVVVGLHVAVDRVDHDPEATRVDVDALTQLGDQIGVVRRRCAR